MTSDRLFFLKEQKVNLGPPIKHVNIDDTDFKEIKPTSGLGKKIFDRLLNLEKQINTVGIDEVFKKKKHKNLSKRIANGKRVTYKKSPSISRNSPIKVNAGPKSPNDAKGFGNFASVLKGSWAFKKSIKKVNVDPTDLFYYDNEDSKANNTNNNNIGEKKNPEEQRPTTRS